MQFSNTSRTSLTKSSTRLYVRAAMRAEIRGKSIGSATLHSINHPHSAAQERAK